MLVYRSATRCAAPSALLDEVDALSAAATRATESDDAWTELLIACGELETAATDAVSPERDDVTPLASATSALTAAAARGALAAWDGRDTGASCVDVAGALRDVRVAVEAAQLPAQLEIGVPEGFAYYGLYPETYAAAARALLEANDAPRIVCIGIRSIGTTLVAVVAAAARHAHRDVATFTVRPRGHPFDRTLVLSPAFEEALVAEATRDALFAVVDEGPGLSGSSFASVADALGETGVADDRIVFFASWNPDAETLRSQRGRARWRRHANACQSVEQLFEQTAAALEIARSSGVPAVHVEDVAAGAWRGMVFTDERDWPAVQPQHERRKYLVRDAAGAPVALLKFAGLGRYGRGTLERARVLGDAGLAPRVIGAHRGFVATEWVPGRPAREGEADGALLDAVARHVAHRATTTRTAHCVAVDALLEVTRVNVGEALGGDFADRLVSALDRLRRYVERVRTCAVDGRMLPHEWIETASGWTKSDGVDHHDDHFLPGDQDPAWDLAGAIVELLLDPREARIVIEAYVRRTGDRDVFARLRFHRVVYLAMRLGYVTLAAESLGDSPDAERLRALARRYIAMLRRAAVTLGAVEATPLPPKWASVRAIVFDADETLRRTTVDGQPCPHAPNEWVLTAWAADGILARLACGDGVAIGVASNQDHVGYGHLSERQARALLRSMLVEATGVVPSRAWLQMCPHVLEEPCACRKPGDGMLRALLSHFDLPPGALLFVGDASTDAEAAQRAGVRFAHVDEFAASLDAARADAHSHLATASAA